MLAITLLLAVNFSQPVQPVAWWSFDSVSDKTVTDVQAKIDDTLSGNHRSVKGVSGDALVFDGYTTVIKREYGKAPKLQSEFTIDTWIAVGAFPWNFVPIVCQNDDMQLGYTLELGPRAELLFKVAINGRMIAAQSDEFVVPSKTWAHIVARYAGEDGLSVFMDGKLVASADIPEQNDFAGRTPSFGVQYPVRQDLIIGAVRQPRRPAAYHRVKGNPPVWYSLDGYIDELKIYDVALSDEVIAADSTTSAAAEFAQRVMPSGPPGPGRFGAYFTNLSYYPEWDGLWRTGPDADLIVRFDYSAARVVFWRGTQYSPAWVTGNGLWMADQSVEGFDAYQTWEHMNDKQNRYSHVRVIESHDARVVVHWRYAPVSVNDKLYNIDERLGDGAWVDEYYYFYPDVTGVRKVTWKRDTLGSPIQFQETIPLTHPGQTQGEVIEKIYATVGNLTGETMNLEFVKNPSASNKTAPDNPTIQMHHFRSDQKPFIIFEPGDEMLYLRDLSDRSLNRPGSSSHWPVGHILSDGRTNQSSDRAGSFLGFPISYPPKHQGDDGRDFINSLYGMTEQPFEELVTLARSWSNPPAMSVEERDFESLGFDRSERIYRLRKLRGDTSAKLSFDASTESPIQNLPLIIENWGTSSPEVKLNGQTLERGDTLRYGYRHTLDGSDLIIWIDVQANKRISLVINSEK